LHKFKFTIMKQLLQLLFMGLFPVISFSQTLEEKRVITKDYNNLILTELAKTFKAEAEFEKTKALELAQQNGWDITKEEKGVFYELMKVSKEGNPMYYATNNVNAAISTRANTLHNGGILGLNVEGQNMTAHVWDAGLARSSHQEYDGPGGNNRFSIGDGTSTLHYHSAHVTGTIIASGYAASAKGMAPQAYAVGYEWNNDISEATTAANNGMLLSNHSYGYGASSLPDWYFGAYISESRSWDIVMYNAPYYLMVVSAGNDGNDNTSNGNPLDGNVSYDKLSAFKTSKNNLVVANANDASIDANGNFISVSINSSSSEGPTDDYRIKPDITGNGTSLYSSLENADNSYGSLTGTSMASPNVCGTLLLLQKHYNNINSNYMRAATLKGLALHTADDAGTSGPDAVYGWGLLNAKAAANAITNNGNASLISELTLNQGNTYTLNVTSDGINNLIASICWTDPAGTANSGTANDNTPVLVNDLDIRVTKGGITYYPYRLTSITTNGTGDNIVDPFEKIIISGASGTYTITVSHKGSLSGVSQNFSLIVTGKTAPAAPPVANFTASTTTPNVGVTVTFTDQSTNTPTSWAWSFNPATVTYVGSSTSTSQNPQVQFNATGYYTVTLTATNAAGSDGETKNNYILASAPPVANFSANNTTPAIGQTVIFTDLSTNSPTFWTWSFTPATITYVGGTNASSQNPQVQFTTGGNYTVSLTAANAAGSDNETKTNYISVIFSPLADFDADNHSPIIGQTVYFWDMSSNSPTSWAWSFSPPSVTYVGGTTANSPEPQVQFAASGSYTVTLTATNASGSDSEIKTNFINVPYPPVANFSASTTTPNVGATVTFTDQSTNTPTSWAWSFSPTTVTYAGGTTSTSQNPQVQFNAAGYYTVTLTATNSAGSDGETKTNYILATAPPVANFSANNTTPNIGQTVSFTDLSTNTPTSWEWSFIPATVTYVAGTSSTSQNPQVQFNAGGLYSVTLTATNASGSDPETKADYISVLFPPVANFSVDITNPAIEQTVTFSDLSINSPTSWNWDFNPATVIYSGATSSASQNPQVQFTAGGLYSVTLTATNASGSDPETKSDYISVLFAPVADFSADIANPAIGQTVTFSDLSTNTPTSWEWSFNPTTVNYVGGTTSTSQNPQVQFTAGGFYTITFTATNASGSDPEVKTDYISVLYAPIADFMADNTNPAIGSPVNFTDLSTNIPASWSWIFIPTTITYLGETTFNSQNPQVQFDAAGFYIVELTVSNASGNDTETKTDYILVINPVIDLDITVYLEGPFNGTSMTTSLNSILPLNQPYGVSPWNYAGTESVAAIPNANVVDWVLVELRDAADAASAISPTMMDRQAAFLLNNGRVVGLDGSSTLQFSNSLTQQLFVVIWHRNHLGMMSSNFLSESEGIYSYNFSTGATQAYGSTDAHKQISPGVWGMIGGDGNRDGNITTTDKTPVWNTQSGTQGYLESDYNLDSQTDNKDKDDVWIPNLGMGSMVPN
jgi:PKD repeat protein